MTLQVTVVRDDVTKFAADVLLLKHAQGFHGADEVVATRLIQSGCCTDGELQLANGDHRLVDTEQAIRAKQVLFLGVPYLSEFRYREMRQFARRAIEILAAEKQPIQSLALTAHGANYGLDIEEGVRSLIAGFQQGLTTHPIPSLQRLVFVERNARRFGALQQQLADVELVMPKVAPATSTAVQPVSVPVLPPEPERKKTVFVAMPFSEGFEDIYEFGIYAAVRRCGYVCEKVDESVFTGNIVERIIDGIKNATFVIADMSEERPNVYLEVGFGWGLNKPVILVAKEGQKLHFDLSHHKCLFYKTIGKLSEQLEKTILQAFGRGTSGAAT
jgi:hypothetical protein